MGRLVIRNESRYRKDIHAVRLTGRQAIVRVGLVAYNLEPGAGIGSAYFFAGATCSRAFAASA